MKKRNICRTVLAAALLVLGSAFSAFAAGWTPVDSEWVYLDSTGEYVRDAWKSDTDGKQYYLGSDGIMVRSSLIESNGGYYYVNSAGAMSVNEWRYLVNPSWQGDSSEEASWYYFGPNGRAYVTANGVVQLQTIGDKKYAFDIYGRMLTGWVSENGEQLPSEEWQNAMYYGDAGGSGNIVTDSWVLINVPDDDNEENAEPLYYFFFGSNGKKTVSADKTIGDKKYHFDERGVATYGWMQGDDDNWKYYGELEDPYLHTGWFQAVPDESMNSDAYNDGTEYWYYATANGEIATSEFRTVGSSTYAFNEYGEMLSGLKVISTEGKNITSIRSVETFDDLPSGGDSGDTDNVYYFAEGDGAVRTGNQSVTIDGTTYSFHFRSNGTPKGAGTNGISDSHIYDHGRCLTAEEGARYQIVSYNDEDYLVSESGAIQKNKKNITDADGYYYCTDKNGIVTHGPLDDKWEE